MQVHGVSWEASDTGSGGTRPPGDPRTVLPIPCSSAAGSWALVGRPVLASCGEYPAAQYRLFPSPGAVSAVELIYPVEISIAFLGSKVFPEQCIILGPKCAIKGFESLLKHVWQVSAVT